MSNSIAFIMDPLDTLTVYRDSTLMMIEAALKRKCDVYIFEPQDLTLKDNQPYVHATPILACDTQKKDWYQLGETHLMPLRDCHTIVIRKDPPFDMDYIFLTYLLDSASQQGVRVVNPPEAIRNFNEKMVIFNFPNCIAPTLVSSNKADIHAFWKQQGEIILKPLDGMAGRNIFQLKADDHNFSSIFESLTHYGKRPIMAQRYLPEVRLGDKRIIILHGKVIPLALARIPQTGEARANLASGGKYQSQTLTKRDLWLCEQVIPFLTKHDICFAGLDIIGDYITEINITSPGCMRELSDASGQNLAEIFLEPFL